MNDTFYLVQRSAWWYDVHYRNNNKLIASFEQEVDGYFNLYMPAARLEGYIPSSHLRLLADMLDEINEPWDKIVEQEMNRHIKISDKQPLYGWDCGLD